MTAYGLRLARKCVFSLASMAYFIVIELFNEAFRQCRYLPFANYPSFNPLKLDCFSHLHHLPDIRVWTLLPNERHEG